MKKRILMPVVILILALAFAACSQPAVTTDNTETNAVPEAAEAEATPEATAEPTEEPTEAPTAAPTPDANPLAKMKLTPQDMDQLIHFWPIEEIDVETQGMLNSISVSTKGKYTNLNYFFTMESSENEIKELYSGVLGGEWEKDEYSAGPIMEGDTDYGVSALCQIVQKELSVFITSRNQDGTDSFNEFFSSKCPVGLVPLHESMTTVSKRGISAMFYDMLLTYTVAYEIDAAPEEVLNFYKEELASCENYDILLDYAGNEIIICTINGVDISVSYDEFGGGLTIDYITLLDQ